MATAASEAMRNKASREELVAMRNSSHCHAPSYVVERRFSICESRKGRKRMHLHMAAALGLPDVRPYTVREGDTAGSIVSKRGLEMNEVRKLNTKIDMSQLQVGQTLLLPAGRFSSRDLQMLQGLETGTDHRKYVVRDKERIKEIVQKRGISLDEVQRLNPNMNLQKIRGGDVLLLPERFSPREREAFSGYVPLEFLQDKPPFWVQMKRALQKSHTKQMRPYTIRKGDTLTSICSKRGLLEEDVRSLNKHIMKLDNLKAGQTILIPGGKLSDRDKLIISGIEKNGVRHYPVRKGETLADIISKRKISVQEIASLNPDLNVNNKLRPGMELLLPADKFTVREKEALEGSGTVPSEYFAPTTVVKTDFLIGFSVFLILSVGAVWALVKERKAIQEKLKSKFNK